MAYIGADKIPLSGFPIGKSLKITVENVASLSSTKADLLIYTSTASPPLETTTTENKQTDTKKPNPIPISSIVDELVKGALKELVTKNNFTGKEGKSCVVRTSIDSSFTNVSPLGLGNGTGEQYSILGGYDAKEVTATSTGEGGGGRMLSMFGASKLGKPISSLISSVKAETAVIYIKHSEVPPRSLQSLLESLYIALSPDDRFKSQKEDPQTLKSLKVVVDGAADDILSLYSSLPSVANCMASGAQLTRELVNSPPNFCNPTTLAKVACDIAKEGGLEIKILGQKECEERKMGAYLAVNQGSSFPPQFIHMTYKPSSGDIKKKIAFIGKGICMDTGGYNLKTGGMIELMKFDMGGSAAVFGAAQVIGSLKPPGVEVHFIVGAAENMISSKAYRPGDILTASNGKTIEVGNTDAEGRLTLADALIYTEKEVKPDMMMDLATLTGAIMVGLGTSIGGLYSNNNVWMNHVLKSAQTTGEPIWPMPLFADYSKHNDGKTGDICNSANTRFGGSITAALFLKEFVKDTPWCHLDLAGPAYDFKDCDATGYGAKLLIDVVMKLSKEGGEA